MNIEIKIIDETNVAFPIVIKDIRGNVIYGQFKDGYSFEATYDENDNGVTFKDSDGYFQMGHEPVTQEQYEAFFNNN